MLYEVITDDSHVYLIDNATKELKRVAVGGGAAELLASGYVSMSGVVLDSYNFV